MVITGYFLFLVQLETALTEVVRACEAVCYSWVFVHSAFTEYCHVTFGAALFWRRSLVDSQQFNEVVDGKVGLEGVDTLRGKLVNLLALRADDLLLGVCLLDQLL